LPSASTLPVSIITRLPSGFRATRDGFRWTTGRTCPLPSESSTVGSILKIEAHLPLHVPMFI